MGVQWLQGPRILVCWFEIVMAGGSHFSTCFPQAADVEPGAKSMTWFWRSGKENFLLVMSCEGNGDGNSSESVPLRGESL